MQTITMESKQNIN